MRVRPDHIGPISPARKERPSDLIMTELAELVASAAQVVGYSTPARQWTPRSPNVVKYR